MALSSFSTSNMFSRPSSTTQAESQALSEYRAAKQANERRYAQAMAIYDEIINRYQPGGTFGKAALSQLEAQKTRDVGEATQKQISSGLFGVQTTAGLPQKWEAEVGAPSRLRLEDLMMERLSQAQMQKASFIERREDEYPDLNAIMQAASAGGTVQSGTADISSYMQRFRESRSGSNQMLGYYEELAAKRAARGGGGGGGSYSGAGSYTGGDSTASATQPSGGTTATSSPGITQPASGSPMTAQSYTEAIERAAGNTSAMQGVQAELWKEIQETRNEMERLGRQKKSTAGLQQKHEELMEIYRNLAQMIYDSYKSEGGTASGNFGQVGGL